jgi:hypothetical protein
MGDVFTEQEWIDAKADVIDVTPRYCFRTLADASAFKERFGRAPERRAVAGRH